MADLASNSTAFYFLVGIFGLCLGSFANVAALRSLDGRDWISAPSSCFACDRRLGWSENMPIYGFLRRGGKCACGERALPRRYVLVELAMAAALLAVFFRLDMMAALSFVPFVLLLGVIFLTDMDAFIIPDWASLGGLALGLALAAFGAPGLPALADAALGAGVGFALIYAINALYRAWRGHDGMGFGDVKLMAMFGAWLGAGALLPILFAASFSGAVFGIVMLSMARLRAGAAARDAAKAMLPFGCFLVPIAFLWLLFAPQMRALLSVAG